MPFFSTWFTDLEGSPVVWLVFDTIFKATLLLLLAAVATALLRRSSAALRHRIWCLALAGLIVLPLLSWLLPHWKLPVFRVPIEATRADASPVPENRPEAVSPILELTDTEIDSHVPEHIASTDADRDRLAEGMFWSDPPVIPESAEPVDPDEKKPLVSEARHQAGSGENAFWILRIWLIGVGLFAIPVLASLWKTFRLRAGACAMTDSAWLSLRDELAGRLGLKRSITLFQTDKPLVPITGGLWQPIILLPRQAQGWSAPLRRSVLLHEMAHVKRWDVAFQWLGRLAATLYWFHPLAWYALGRLRIEREFASDDCVLTTGERPSDYAEQLLEIARQFRPHRLQTAVAMTQPSSLERRIRALFDRAGSHLPLSARTARLLLLGTLGLVAGLAVIQPGTESVANEPSETGILADEADSQSAPERKEAANSAGEGEEVIQVSGRVLDAKDQPLQGVTVFATRSETDRSLFSYNISYTDRVAAKTITDREGRFRIAFSHRKQNSDTYRGPRSSQESRIVALKDGYGPAWSEVRGEKKIVSGLSLKLVRDDQPITGRVLNLEGLPVSDVTIRIRSLAASPQGEMALDHWLKEAKEPAPDRRRGFLSDLKGLQELLQNKPRPQWQHLRAGSPALPKPVRTDAQGRFRLEGLGRDRIVQLEVGGPKVVRNWVTVVTRPIDEIRRQGDRSSNPVGSPLVYGADCEIVAAPSQPVHGVVRDAKTKEPLPGVLVTSDRWAGSMSSVEGVITTRTDKQGRYQIEGLPKGQGNTLKVFPADDQPYFINNDIEVPVRTGLAPIRLDIELKRGIWITGRITDKTTGKPVPSAIHYYPFLSNEYAANYPNFRADLISASWTGFRYRTREDGSYRIVGLPGPGLIAVKSFDHTYRTGVGAEKITERTDRGRFLAYNQPSPKQMHAFRKIDPAADADDVICDFALDRGGSLVLRFADPDGTPLKGVMVAGGLRESSNFDDPLSEDRLSLSGLASGQTRTLLLYHPERNLGQLLELNSPWPAEKTVRLKACGSVRGQLLDPKGQPIAGAQVRIVLLPKAYPGQEEIDLPAIKTDDQGRFHYEGLPPGGKYFVGARGETFDSTILKKDVSITSGKPTDLGKLTVPAGD